MRLDYVRVWCCWVMGCMVGWVYCVRLGGVYLSGGCRWGGRKWGGRWRWVRVVRGEWGLVIRGMLRSSRGYPCCVGSAKLRLRSETTEPLCIKHCIIPWNKNKTTKCIYRLQKERNGLCDVIEAYLLILFLWLFKRIQKWKIRIWRTYLLFTNTTLNCFILAENWYVIYLVTQNFCGSQKMNLNSFKF